LRIVELRGSHWRMVLSRVRFCEGSEKNSKFAGLSDSFVLLCSSLKSQTADRKPRQKWGSLVRGMTSRLSSRCAVISDSKEKL